MAAHNITLLSYLPLCGQCDGSDGYELINGSLVTEIGKKYHKSGAQVSIRWLVQSGVPAIPRSKKFEYTQQDISIFDFALSAEDMAALDGAVRPKPADGPAADCGIP
jgi:diketogulonate reductase-like aldo/keto reductase